MISIHSLLRKKKGWIYCTAKGLMNLLRGSTGGKLFEKKRKK